MGSALFSTRPASPAAHLSVRCSGPRAASASTFSRSLFTWSSACAARGPGYSSSCPAPRSRPAVLAPALRPLAERTARRACRRTFRGSCARVLRFGLRALGGGSAFAASRAAPGLSPLLPEPPSAPSSATWLLPLCSSPPRGRALGLRHLATRSRPPLVELRQLRADRLAPRLRLLRALRKLGTRPRIVAPAGSRSRAPRAPPRLICRLQRCSIAHQGPLRRRARARALYRRRSPLSRCRCITRALGLRAWNTTPGGEEVPDRATTAPRVSTRASHPALAIGKYETWRRVLELGQTPWRVLDTNRGDAAKARAGRRASARRARRRPRSCRRRVAQRAGTSAISASFPRSGHAGAASPRASPRPRGFVLPEALVAVFPGPKSDAVPIPLASNRCRGALSACAMLDRARGRRLRPVASCRRL